VFARLRAAIQQLNVPGTVSGRSLTFSMGAVEVTGPADDLERLIKRADDALYRAKQGGRDRYELG
jgi:diguanylate cyclase (GGDEF)-like protein